MSETSDILNNRVIIEIKIQFEKLNDIAIQQNTRNRVIVFIDCKFNSINIRTWCRFFTIRIMKLIFIALTIILKKYKIKCFYFIIRVMLKNLITQFFQSNDFEFQHIYVMRCKNIITYINLRYRFFVINDWNKTLSCQ